MSNAKIRTIDGSLLRFKKSGDSVFVENSKILIPDIGAYDGVIQVIDQVLLPTKGECAEENIKRPEFSQFWILWSNFGVGSSGMRLIEKKC